MKQMLFKEKYPIFTLEVSKDETNFKSIEEIVSFFKNKIEQHPIATFIAEFDHFSHTKSFEDGVVVPGMIDARNVVFCFGKEIPTSKIMAVRPRSIGISEFEAHYEFGILEVPNEMLHTVLEGWIKEIGNKQK